MDSDIARRYQQYSLMSNKTKNRYWIAALLFIVSILPQVLVLPLFGSINLVFLILLWFVLIATILFGSRLAATMVAVLASAAMAVPPVPYYLWPSNIGVLHLQFAGWGAVLHALYGVAFLFAFYFVLFELAIFTCRGVKRERQEKTMGRGN